jgi:hypothetical protein
MFCIQFFLHGLIISNNRTKSKQKIKKTSSPTKAIKSNQKVHGHKSTHGDYELQAFAIGTIIAIRKRLLESWHDICY